MQRIEYRTLRPLVAGFFLSLLLGVLVPVSPQLALLIAAAVLAVCGLTVPAWIWCTAALSSALLARGLVTLGVLPGAAAFFDIPLAWGALIVALLRHFFTGDKPPLSRLARQVLWGIGLLAVAVFASFAANPSEAARPILYLTLLGEPFAVIAALLVEPPSERAKSGLQRALLWILAIQIPVVLAQIAAYGFTDDIKGTLHGAGAGHHAIGAVTIVGGIWILLSRRPAPARLALGIPLMLIPFASDAKQVLFAVPAALLFQRLSGESARKIGLFLLIAVLGIGLFRFYGASGAAVDFLEQQQEGESGKLVSAQLVWGEVTSDAPSLVFGRGPAETVSRAAFMTTDRYLGADSPLRFFGLHASPIAQEAFQEANELSGGRTSLNSALSSALGVLGDLGFLGAITFVYLFGSVVVALRRVSNTAAVAALAGWGMYALLGFVYDWWEQPPFSMTLAILSGLAFAASKPLTEAE